VASKRDQLHAYQFMVQRVLSAIITRESDPETPPFRRPTMVAIFSILLAFVSLGAVWIFGLLVPGGNNTWRDGKSVVVEKETGTQYIYVGGKLVPVLNYASAVLALGDYAETTSVSQASLAGVPRGPEIGIPNAPNSLPSADRVLLKGWTLCSVPITDESGGDAEKSTLLVGHEQVGGLALGDKAMVLTESGTKTTYLVWQGNKHLIKNQAVVLGALALLGQPPRYVSKELLDTLPTGETIAPLKVPGLGKKSSAVASRDYLRTGEVLRASTRSGDYQYYLAHRKALRPITPLQAEIQLADEQTTRKAYRNTEPKPAEVSAFDVNDADIIETKPPSEAAPPSTRPEFVDPGRGRPSVCATYDSGQASPRVQVNPQLPPTRMMAPSPGISRLGLPLADEVYVPPGWVSIVEVVPTAGMMSDEEGSLAGTVLVVTDRGRAYPLDEAETLKILGYGSVRPLRMSSEIVARIPLGPSLSQAAALQPAERPTNKGS